MPPLMLIIPLMGAGLFICLQSDGTVFAVPLLIYLYLPQSVAFCLWLSQYLRPDYRLGQTTQRLSFMLNGIGRILWRLLMLFLIIIRMTGKILLIGIMDLCIFIRMMWHPSAYLTKTSQFYINFMLLSTIFFYLFS